MEITIRQACALWDKLRDAMEGKASHGHEAEIYAYTLMPSCPALHMKNLNHSAEYIRAAKSLVEMITMFRGVYPDCYAFIDGVDYYFWLEKIHQNFTHRVMVEIRKQG